MTQRCDSCRYYNFPYDSTPCHSCDNDHINWEQGVEAESVCNKCDGPGGVKTFENQVCMPINGKVQCIDHCIHHIVAALNAGGVETVASCCGHGTQRGRIDLADGRVLFIEGEKK